MWHTGHEPMIWPRLDYHSSLLILLLGSPRFPHTHPRYPLRILSPFSGPWKLDQSVGAKAHAGHVVKVEGVGSNQSKFHPQQDVDADAGKRVGTGAQLSMMKAEPKRRGSSPPQAPLLPLLPFPPPNTPRSPTQSVSLAQSQNTSMTP